YEEKVVDLIIARASVTDKAVSKEELLKEDELPEGFGEPAKPTRKKAVKPKAKAGGEVEPGPTTKVAGSPAKAKTAVKAPADQPKAKPSRAKAKAAPR
ncbi:MAG: hypothetical protein H0X27_12320, partial [Caulobacteraceae bacterium]|nr:hypothetical protein [Caulobacteraceae bacterium]